MKSLVKTLHTGGHSLVVRTAAGVILTFNHRGVADLHALYHDETSPLRGASVADKVVGLGAALLMVAGGVSHCHTDVISSDALRLIKNSGVDCDYDAEVPEIINRAGTGRCPLETRLAPLHDIEAMLAETDRFVKEMSI